MRQARLAPALLVAIVTFSLAAQEPPKFRGATVTTIRAAGDLRRQIISLDSSSERVWAGYSIPIARTRRVEVCCSYRCGSCSLERDDVNITNAGDDEFFHLVAGLLKSPHLPPRLTDALFAIEEIARPEAQERLQVAVLQNGALGTGARLSSHTLRLGEPRSGGASLSMALGVAAPEDGRSPLRLRLRRSVLQSSNLLSGCEDFPEED